MKVLVITTGNDPHVGMVQQHLKDDIIRFDPSLFPLQSSLTYRFDGRNFAVTANEVALSACTAVWYRKPHYVKTENLPVAEEHREFIRTSCSDTVKALYALMRDRLWVSDPWKIWRSNNKLYQMEVAAKLGFVLPRTIVTNNVAEVSAFRLSLSGDMVVKPMSSEAVTVDGWANLVYTTRISTDAHLNLGGLAVSPCMFQEYVPKALDLRVTVVGDEVFACEISQQGEMTGKADWRQGVGSSDITYSPHQLPATLEASCAAIVKAMGLRFGAIDLVLDPQGVYWFLEINPNGQWGFVELYTGLPISRALAEMFERGY